MSDLRQLSDPEFFTQWAAVRSLLCRTPKENLEHGEIKLLYDKVAAEYSRRVNGGLAVTDTSNSGGH